MAEVIALGASIIAIVQIADRVIGLCKMYLETVHNCPSDLRVMLIETSTMKAVLENVGFLVSCNNEQSTMLDGLSGVDGPLHGCESTIAKMEALFPSLPVQAPGRRRTKRQKVEASLASLAWPFKAEKAKRLVEELGRFKETISLALIAGSCHDIKHIRGQNENIFTILSDQQRDKVHQWLQVTDPSPLHHRACKQYEPETGNWMLRSTEWTTWLDGKTRCLWIFGIPGAGKTVLASYLIKNIERICHSTTESYASVYYYCYFGHNQEEGSPFLRWSINQICRKAKLIPSSLNELYGRGGQPSTAELLGILETIIQDFDRVYIVVDAIDESKPRDDLLAILRDLATDPRFSKIQLLATSRQYIDIETILEPVSVSVSMKNPLLDADIKLYVRSKLYSNPKFKRWPQPLLEEVVEVLATKAKGMFRWVVCQIYALERLKPESNVVKSALANLPKTIFETYERIFQGIPDEDQVIVSYAMKWIYFHREMLETSIPTQILLEAIQRSTYEWNSEKLDYSFDEELLRDLCGSLITIDYKSREYIDSSSVRCASFAHYTVWEFLSSTTVWKNPVCLFRITEAETKMELAGTVIREALKADTINTEIQTSALNHHFNTYCMVQSIFCLAELGPELSQNDNLMTLICRLFDSTSQHYPNFRRVLSIFSDKESALMSIIVEFSALEWSKSSARTDAALFTTLLYVDKSTKLADSFLRGKNKREVFQTSLEITQFLMYDEHRYKFRGSVVEFFALPNELFPQFEYLLETGFGLHDPSTVLQSVIANHGYVGNCSVACAQSCPLSRILQLGANANGTEYVATPLQIAVSQADLEGVQTLLEAGADSNHSGREGGAKWEEGTCSEDFNCLAGLAPLEICSEWTQNETTSKIRTLLLRYGARKADGGEY